MNIGVIIPDRGDRPKMTANCLKQMDDQSVRGIGDVVIAHVNYPPKGLWYDITERYIEGYNQLRGQGLDMIACIENDDWYHPDYLLECFEAYERLRRPELLGIEYTYYYHLRMRFYFKYLHPGRASMMCTCLKPDIEFSWPQLGDRFTDMWLWTRNDKPPFCTNKKFWEPDKPIAIGMKGHFEGKFGGTGHDNKMYRYVIPDNGFLKDNLSEEQFNFFTNFKNANIPDPSKQVTA